MCDIPNKDTINILVGCTGSVASVKVPLLTKSLAKLSFKKSSGSENYPVNVQVVPTAHALHFFNYKTDLDCECILDEQEWSTWKTMGDKVLHIELRRWADILIIAPLDANTMAKMCYGLCDNLLTCVVRAWDMSKPLLFCPAMNTHMYEHPITSQQINMLKGMGYIEIPSISKKLACGDLGIGAMANVDTIVSKADESIKAYLQKLPN